MLTQFVAARRDGRLNKVDCSDSTDLLTAESGRENVAYIAKLGVRDYLVKPFQDEQLIEKVKRVIALQPKVVAVAV